MSYYILSPKKNSSFFKLPIDILFIILKITLRSFLPLLLYPPVNQMLKNENTLLPLRRILLPGFPQPVFYVISSQKFPTFHSPRTPHPDIRRILTAAIPHSNLIKCFHQYLCIFLINLNIFVNLSLSFFRENCCPTFLNDVRHTIRFCCTISYPHFI